MRYYVYQKWSCSNAGEVLKKEVWKDNKKVRYNYGKKLSEG
jgi:hypothetical protein